MRLCHNVHLPKDTLHLNFVMHMFDQLCLFRFLFIGYQLQPHLVYFWYQWVMEELTFDSFVTPEVTLVNEIASSDTQGVIPLAASTPGTISWINLRYLAQRILSFHWSHHLCQINFLTAITSRVATLISASSKVHVTIEYHVKQTRTISEELIIHVWFSVCI